VALVLRARIAELEQVRDGLAMSVGCGCLTTLLRAVVNPDDALATTGAGARRVFPHEG
jgi:MerR family redox-sensitive transcriptional activator SoxR